MREVIFGRTNKKRFIYCFKGTIWCENKCRRKNRESIFVRFDAKRFNK